MANNRNKHQIATAPSASRPPHSLKGIVSTNDDPNKCALCSIPFPVEGMEKFAFLAYCCGKRACEGCAVDLHRLIGQGRGRHRCTFCNSLSSTSRKSEIGHLKKHAKKGKPWAQFVLGVSHEFRDGNLRSYHDAKRWYEKAAKQGHPHAMEFLASFYVHGHGGCSVDLSKARRLIASSTAIVGDETRLGRMILVLIADRVDDTAEAKSILIPLAEGGMASAQVRLADILFRENDTYHSKLWCTAAALQDEKFGAYEALTCCGLLGNISEANFWLNVVTSKPELMADGPAPKAYVEYMSGTLRDLRDHCGGCDALLSGERRQYCKQCKAYCYCNRECQKLHWNRIGGGGHAEECKKVKFLKDEMKKMRRARMEK